MSGERKGEQVKDFAVDVTEIASGSVLVRVHGELDLDTVGRLWTRLAPLLVQDAVVVLDTAHMPFMDSSGLRLLLQAAHRAAEVGAVFRVAGLRRSLRHIVELACVGGQLTFRDDVSDAMAG